ncbi:MAG TPA: response regulator, partial [Chroococcidiopsis sp.]
YRGDRRKILIVDDRWENRSVIVNLLSPLGFELIEAHNGEDALERAERDRPDLVITDLAMPVMDGFELTRRLRQSPILQPCQIIASSASVFDLNRQQSQAVGCDDFLPKPVQANQLFEQLATHLGLVWCYATDTERAPADAECDRSDTEWVIPDVTELTRLYDVARIGDIEGIEQEVYRLQQADPEYVPLAREILRLVETFDIDEIVKLVRRYLPND